MKNNKNKKKTRVETQTKNKKVTTKNKPKHSQPNITNAYKHATKKRKKGK